jgi:hypothetical protein
MPNPRARPSKSGGPADAQFPDGLVDTESVPRVDTPGSAIPPLPRRESRRQVESRPGSAAHQIHSEGPTEMRRIRARQDSVAGRAGRWRQARRPIRPSMCLKLHVECSLFFAGIIRIHAWDVMRSPSSNPLAIMSHRRAAVAQKSDIRNEWQYLQIPNPPDQFHQTPLFRKSTDVAQSLIDFPLHICSLYADHR